MYFDFEVSRVDCIFNDNLVRLLTLPWQDSSDDQITIFISYIVIIVTAQNDYFKSKDSNKIFQLYQLFLAILVLRLVFCLVV